MITGALALAAQLLNKQPNQNMKIQNLKSALLAVISALVIIPCQGEVVIISDSRKIETASDDPITASFNQQFDVTLDSYYIPSDKLLAHQVVSQRSGSFEGSRWVCDGEATVNTLDGKSHGAWGRSTISLELIVTEAVGFTFKGACRGASRSYTLVTFSGPAGRVGTDIRFGGNEQLDVSGTLQPGKYNLEAKCYARASSDSTLEYGSFHFELEFDQPAKISVTPIPVDFGTVLIRQPKEQSVRIANVGGSKSLLQVWVQQPNDTYFSLVDPVGTTLMIPGGTFVDIGLRLKVSGNPAVYESQLNASLPIDSNDPDNPHLEVPLRVFVKGPEPISFSKAGSCSSYMTDILEAQLAWASSTGWRSDLEGVEIREILRPADGWLPANDNNVTAPAPWVMQMPAAWMEKSHWAGDGRTVSLCPLFPPPDNFSAGLDAHGTYAWKQPLREAEFGIEQIYQWRAPWKPEWTDLLQDTIKRRIYRGPVFWHYEVSSKYAGSCTATLGFAFIRNFTATMSPSGKTVTLNLVGTPGSSYEVQRTGSLNGPWETVTTFTVASPSDGAVSFVDTNPPTAAAFYRLKELTPN